MTATDELRRLLDERVGEYVCSECGETFNDGHGEFPRYCPNCGRKVVE